MLSVTFIIYLCSISLKIRLHPFLCLDLQKYLLEKKNTEFKNICCHSLQLTHETVPPKGIPPFCGTILDVLLMDAKIQRQYWKHKRAGWLRKWEDLKYLIIKHFSYDILGV